MMRGRDWEQWLVQKKKIRLISGGLFFVVLTALLGMSYALWQGAHYMLVSLLVLVAVFVLLALNFERRRPRAREVVLLSTMTGLTVAVNEICSHTIPLHAGTTFVIISGIAMGPEAGFMVGALARFLCNFFAGQGPWTPWEMIAWGLIGYLSGLLFNKIELRGKHEETTLADRLALKKTTTFRVLLGPVVCIFVALLVGYVVYLLTGSKGESFLGWRVYAFGLAGLILGGILQRKRLPVDVITTSVYTFFVVVILYGGMMNFAAMLMSVDKGGEVSLEALKLLYITGLPYDLAHAGTAAICMFLLGDVILQKLQRIQVKFGIGA